MAVTSGLKPCLSSSGSTTRMLFVEDGSGTVCEYIF